MMCGKKQGSSLDWKHHWPMVNGHLTPRAVNPKEGASDKLLAVRVVMHLPNVIAISL